MRSDPAADVYPDGSDLCTIHPNAFVTSLRDTFAGNAKNCERVYQRPLNASKIGAYIAPPFSQIKDRIAHDLTGTMICHIPAAVRFKEINPCARKNFFASEHVLQFC